MDLDFGTSIIYLDIFCCIQQTWQAPCSDISQTVPSSLAANQISMSGHFSSLWWHLYILLFCSLQVSMIFLFLCLYILQLSLTWPWTWSALRVSWPQSSASTRRNWPMAGGVCSVTGSSWHRSTIKTCRETSVVRDSSAQLKQTFDKEFAFHIESCSHTCKTKLPSTIWPIFIWL